MDHKGEHKRNVDDNEENPEEDVSGEITDHLKGEGKANPHEDKVSRGGDISVAELVDLQED